MQLKLTSAARPRAVLCATATTKMSVLRGSGLTSTKFRPLATTAISLLKVGQWHSRTWQLHSVFLVVGNSRTLVGTPSEAPHQQCPRRLHSTIPVILTCAVLITPRISVAKVPWPGGWVPAIVTCPATSSAIDGRVSDNTTHPRRHLINSRRRTPMVVPRPLPVPDAKGATHRWSSRGR